MRLQQRERVGNWCWWTFTKVKENSFSIGVYDLDLFRSYAAFQAYMSQFWDAPLLVEGSWSTLSPRYEYSNMVCHQSLEFSSLKSWGCIRKLSERILCKCRCWRRGNQVLGERKAVLNHTRLLGRHSTHQQANITYPTDIWWTESGWGDSSGSFRSEFGILLQWEVNKCGISFSWIKAAHDDHV